MNKFLEQALLFDFYGELLTDHQKEIYEQFALEDLSLSEIAEMKGISRQGVHDLTLAEWECEKNDPEEMVKRIRKIADAIIEEL